jgi:ketosteroid isomerase-like protein
MNAAGSVMKAAGNWMKRTWTTGSRHFDPLQNRFVALLVRSVAKRCRPLRPRRTLAPGCCRSGTNAIDVCALAREQHVMGTRTTSRRAVLKAGPCALVGAVGIPELVSAHTQVGLDPKSAEIVRRWYAAWEQKQWRPVDILLADDFTFSSAAGDDHLSKSAFKKQCWETQKDFIARFDLQRVFGSGNEAMVMYLCHTTNGRTFRNVEYLRLRDDKVAAIECYFGAQSSFPSAVSRGQR